MKEIKRVLCAIIALLVVFSVNTASVFAEEPPYKKVDSFTADGRISVEKYTQNDGDEVSQEYFLR